jgi:hypothetical protein
MLFKKKWYLVFISVMALSNIMCGLGILGFNNENFTKSKPEPEQMAGIYLPIEKTEKLIESQYNLDIKEISISLNPDGTFEMNNMPDWWATDSGDSSGGVDTGKGKWDIEFDEYDGEYWKLSLDFETGTFSSGEIFDTWIHIGNNQPPYSLWFYIGGPDGAVMIFEQVLENPQ